MIFEVVNAISKELNLHLKYQFGSTEDLVVFSNILDLNGGKALQQDNTVHCLVLKIEEDRTLNKTGGYRGPSAPTPSLFNVHVFFAATHSGKQYPEGVNLITRIIEYFVQNQSLDSTKIEGLPDNIDRLTVDYLSFEYNELSNVWSTIGTKLLPFAAYKIGFIPIQPIASLSSKIERISGMGTNLDQKN